ncbi:MAG TPA: toll/interleukin-1 receptor domain-containing protein [Candidatus Angelobacter sp.]
MADLSNFEYDAFISYAHLDNEHPKDTPQGWIDKLHEILRQRLSMALGRETRIWRDLKLSGNDDFNETIVTELAKTAVLVSVLTPRYVNSNSCRQELQQFLRVASGNTGIQIGDKHRVFKVIKTYIPLEKHPPEVQRLLGYEFYEKDALSGRAREFDDDLSPGRKDMRYWSRLLDLAEEICDLIQLLQTSSTSNTTAPPTSGAIIYLAETTSDLVEQRDRIKRELQQYGHTLLPDKPLPLSGPAFQDAVREYLSRSRFSIHLIGEHYGVVPEMEPERSVVRLQHELAVARTRDAGFSQLIWLQPGLNPIDKRQQKFVADLQSGSNVGVSSELTQVKLEDFKTIIQGKLSHKAQAVPVRSEPAGPTYIYVICDRQDMNAAEPLQNYLLDQGFEAVLPLAQGSEVEVLEDHRQNLLDCDGVVVFQSQAGEAWLRMKLRELIKLPGYGRTTPLRSKAVYIAGPQSQQKDQFKTNEALTIRNYGNFTPELLSPFVQQINSVKGGA